MDCVGKSSAKAIGPSFVCVTEPSTNVSVLAFECVTEPSTKVSFQVFECACEFSIVDFGLAFQIFPAGGTLPSAWENLCAAKVGDSDGARGFDAARREDTGNAGAARREDTAYAGAARITSFASY